MCGEVRVRERGRGIKGRRECGVKEWIEKGQVEEGEWRSRAVIKATEGRAGNRQTVSEGYVEQDGRRKCELESGAVGRKRRGRSSDVGQIFREAGR